MTGFRFLRVDLFKTPKNSFTYKEAKRVGELPPIIIAAMRDKMITLGARESDGIVFANAARSAIAGSLQRMNENQNLKAISLLVA